ncbi:unnamed protein product [Hymenolepis diminuta]|uniref:Uncharacterized protein n=1 Tax=Hymenolepis diminuta TaxID=6216 RepID=A0A564YBM5_HYMDI|nr:unnamed protein product [Hymenolepis diminuta]
MRRTTLHAFPELLFIPILYDNTSVFRPRGWSDVFFVPMTNNPCLSCLNTPIGSPFSYNRLVLPKKYTCAHVLGRPYPSCLCFPLNHKANLSVTGSYGSCSSPLLLSTLPSLSLSFLLNSLWPP